MSYLREMKKKEKKHKHYSNNKSIQTPPSNQRYLSLDNQIMIANVTLESEVNEQAYPALWLMEPASAFPEPQGRMPTGVFIACSQSGRSISPLITYQKRFRIMVDTVKADLI